MFEEYGFIYLHYNFRVNFNRWREKFILPQDFDNGNEIKQMLMKIYSLVYNIIYYGWGFFTELGQVRSIFLH